MRTYLWIVFVALTLMFSCSKDEYTYYTGEEYDRKASQMEQTVGLFDAIARNPEMADQLIEAAEQDYASYTELLPLSDKAIPQRGKARGAAFSALFSAIARQPDAYDALDAAAEQFLGPYDEAYISDELREVTRTYSMSALYESIARQPEASGLLNAACSKYLNFEFEPEE